MCLHWFRLCLIIDCSTCNSFRRGNNCLRFFRWLLPACLWVGVIWHIQGVYSGFTWNNKIVPLIASKSLKNRVRYCHSLVLTKWFLQPGVFHQIWTSVYPTQGWNTSSYSLNNKDNESSLAESFWGCNIRKKNREKWRFRTCVLFLPTRKPNR